jgi:NADH-quinone oxidoreductase subunit J
MVELVVFAVAGAACVVGALGVVLARNPVHAALMLVMTLFGIAVLFVAQEAHFLAVVQVIVYAGAIVVLILFVIMLLGVDRAQDLELRSLPAQVPAAAAFAAVGLGVLVAMIVSVDDPATGAPAVSGALDTAVPNVDQLAVSLFEDYVYAFELTSVLLVIAVVAAVVLARRPSPAERVQLEALVAEELADDEAERAQQRARRAERQARRAERKARRGARAVAVMDRPETDEMGESETDETDEMGESETDEMGESETGESETDETGVSDTAGSRPDEVAEEAGEPGGPDEEPR